MRQIKFRGKRLDNGEWIEGNYSELNGVHFITPKKNAQLPSSQYEVNPATVGQFTDLLDKNGKEIYEGDVIQMWLEDSVEPDGGRWHRMYVVFTIEKGFVLWGERMTIEDAEPLHEMWQWKQFEVIGNIHDNPELLK